MFCFGGCLSIVFFLGGGVFVLDDLFALFFCWFGYFLRLLVSSFFSIS